MNTSITKTTSATAPSRLAHGRVPRRLPEGILTGYDAGSNRQGVIQTRRRAASVAAGADVMKQQRSVLVPGDDDESAVANESTSAVARGSDSLGYSAGVELLNRISK